jgi:hypothetical protein
MELAAVENSRIILLTRRVRPAGQIYLPDAAVKLVQRYSFAKFPSMEELIREPIAFSIGKFGDVQINEFQIYQDGIVVSSRAPTEVLDAFISDLFSWSEMEFGMVEAADAKPEKFIESSLVVKSTKDLALCISPASAVIDVVNDALRRQVTGVPYQLSGFSLEADPGALLDRRRRPIRFAVERRANTSFNDNIFFSVAPLHTKDHLAVLASMEALPLAHQAPAAAPPNRK